MLISMLFLFLTHVGSGNLVLQGDQLLALCIRYLESGSAGTFRRMGQV